MDGNSPNENNKRRVDTLTLPTKMQPRAPDEVYVSPGPPPFVQTKLTQAPRFGELFWCSLPKDAEPPELWKRRPVVVISPKNALKGTTTILPTSTDEQEENEWAHELSLSIDTRTSFALCDKIMTLAAEVDPLIRTVLRLS